MFRIIRFVISLLPLFLAADSLNLLTDEHSAGDPKYETHLILENIRPITETESGHLHVILSFGKDAVPTAEAFADYNEKSTNQAEVLRFEKKGEESQGELTIEIGPDGARRGRAHFPTPPDRFQVTFRLTGSEQTVWADPPTNREAFMPSWRKDTPWVAGWNVEGVYEGTWKSRHETTDVEGVISGAWRFAQISGAWHPVGPAVLQRGDSDSSAVEFQAFLPDTQRVDGIAAWAERRIEPAWMLPHGALNIHLAPLDAKVPVDILPVSVAVKTERGWFYGMDRLRLTKTGDLKDVVPLSSLGNRWRPFAGNEIQAVRIGVVNGSGVGRIPLGILDLQLSPHAPEPVRDDTRIVLYPNVIRSYNGASRIPKGLFGFHVVGEEVLKRTEGEPPPLANLETYRPGLLRPLTHTDFSPAPAHGIHENLKKMAAAGDAEDLVVWTHTMDLWARPVWMNEGMTGLATRLKAHYAELAEVSWTPEHPERLFRYFEVWNEPFMWGRHINMGFRLPEGVPDIQDKTQYGYIPGKVGADAWSVLFESASVWSKAINPHMQLGGPSAPNISSHNYADFRNYTERILKRVGGDLDFFTEHHYGGNPLNIAAGYEVVRTAFHHYHDRKVPIINTEANDLGASDAGKALYNLTEILHLIQTQPDLVKGRALHALWNGRLRSSGERDAWTLMGPLRGEILDLSVDNARMTAVASHPEPGKVVLIGADHGVSEQQIRISLPGGFRIQSLTLLLTEPPEEELRIRDVDGAGIPEIPEGKTRMVDVLPRMENREIVFTLPARSAFRLILEKEGYGPYRTRAQHSVPVDAFFSEIPRNEALSLSLPEEKTPDPDRLFLRMVRTGGFRLEAGDETLDLPAASHRLEEAEIEMIEVPPVFLKRNPQLVALDHGGVVLSASWVWE